MVMSGEQKRAISQKAGMLEVLQLEGLTDLQAKVAEETLIFIRANGENTGNETYTHWSSRDVWRLVRVSRPEFHKFAETQKLCSSRYVWKVMKRLVNLGYVHVFTAKRERGYGLTVDAIKRHKVAASRYEKFMMPLRKGAT
jgi:hypothetical protein